LSERLDVETLTGMAKRLIAAGKGKVELATPVQLQQWIDEGAVECGITKYSNHFLWTEWLHVVDAWQITDREGYRAAPRLGRRARLTEALRDQLWPVFAHVLAQLSKAGLRTEAQLYLELGEVMASRARAPYDHVVVDEAQDLSVPQLRLLAAFAGRDAEGLFFSGDIGQRIFQPPFSWKSLGVDIRGRSRTLKVNYRTSQEIRRRADDLMARTVADVDGNEEVRSGTTSVFSGPEPQILAFASAEKECEAVAAWITDTLASGITRSQIGVFVRSESQFPRAQAALERAGVLFTLIDGAPSSTADAVQVATMHLAKGLEFRAVAVMACDDDAIPDAERLSAVSDAGELEEMFETERQLLYVACTRARDRLIVSGVAPISEFLRDLSPAIKHCI